MAMGNLPFAILHYLYVGMFEEHMQSAVLGATFT